MSNDADWVEDVKRWCESGRSAAAAAGPAAADDSVLGTDFALGYEAAHPALQARHWTETPGTSFELSRY